MTKQKKKPQTNKSNKPQRVNQRNTPINQPLAPATQPTAPKRQISDLSLFLRRQESISPPTVEQRFPLQHFIKSTSIQFLVLQCVGLKMAIDKINTRISVDRNLLYSVVQKYLHGMKNQLWCDKYRPMNLNESLHSQMGERIKSWLRVFYSYRNTVFEQSNSFIDDYFGQNSNNQEFKLLKQYGWRLRGLIIKGREGVGKATVINCTARQMQYEILSCGNQCNQIKYLKQKNEATQSQCVKTKISKNQTQIQRTNRSITTFAVQKQQPEQQTQQSKRIQLMRNVNQFYPREDETKFFNQLNKTIQSSKIPFIMTVNGQDVPENLSKPQKNNSSNQQKFYDVIEFQQAKTQDIAMLMYLIYHVELAFGKCLDLEKIVQKEKFKEVFNQQLARFQFQIKSPYIDFIRLTEVFNKKLVPLFTFVQGSILMSKSNQKNIKDHFSYEMNLNKAEQQIKQYLQRAGSSQLMNDYFLVQPPPSSSTTQIKQQQTSKDYSSTMQISKYLIDASINEQKKQMDSGEIPTFVCTPNKEEDFDMQNDRHSKTKTVVKNKQQQMQQQQQKIPSTQSEQKPFSQTLNQLKMKVISDYNKSIINDQCYIFNKLYNQSRDQLEQQTIQNIPIQRHKIIRKQILNNIKKEFYSQNELNTTMKQNQLNFLGFLIDSRARVSRKKVTVKQQLNLKKLLKQNQINYMKTFTDFVRPNSMENSNK